MIYGCAVWNRKRWNFAITSQSEIRRWRVEVCLIIYYGRSRTVRVSGGHLCIYAEAPTEPTGETGDRLRWRDSIQFRYNNTYYNPLNLITHKAYIECEAYITCRRQISLCDFIAKYHYALRNIILQLWLQNITFPIGNISLGSAEHHYAARRIFFVKFAWYVKIC